LPDLAVGNFGQQNQVYANDGAGNFSAPVALESEVDAKLTNSIAWGDMDGDGDLDLAVGNGHWLAAYDDNDRLQQNEVYTNDGTGNFSAPVALGSKEDVQFTQSIAWGDMDGDGDLDLAAGNNGQQNEVYANDGAGNFSAPIALESEVDAKETNSIAWGDMDRDGDLDLAVGNSDGDFARVGQNQVYANDGAGNFSAPVALESVIDAQFTQSIAWGDMDGDGDLDLAVGNGESNQVYANDGAGNFSAPVALKLVSHAQFTKSNIAWGDMDGDGDLDLAAGNRFYANHRYHRVARQPVLSGIAVTNEHAKGGIALYPTMSIISEPIIPLSYTLFGFTPTLALSNTVQPANIVVEYATGAPDEMEKRWQPAIATVDTLTKSLSVGTHVYYWDTFSSGFFGQSDHVQLRITAYSVTPKPENIQGAYLYTNTVANSFQHPYISTTTMPFRLRGTQAQVVNRAGNAVDGALVYRLKEGQKVNGFLLGPGLQGERQRAAAFKTNKGGYLGGQDRVGVGDQLLAMAPAPDDWWREMPWMHHITETSRLTETVRLYYTNATFTESGELATKVTNKSSGQVANRVTGPGVQILEVSENNPLYLFDLLVSLEWDASTTYLNQLEEDLQQASAFLYEFTDGQAALGNITVTQNKEDWDYADVTIQASNRKRPYAIQGGIVTTTTVDIGLCQNSPVDECGVVYNTGHVRMGATWNSHGDPGRNDSTDWSLTLAHELSHYLFFLDDTYLGIDDDGLLIAVDECHGSAMGDMYNSANRGFLPNAEWGVGCQKTLTHRTLKRSEEETVKLFYPAYQTGRKNAGPTYMPFQLTEVKILEPLTKKEAFSIQDYSFTYKNNIVHSPEARVYLIKDDSQLVEMGTVVGQQNKLHVRGASSGDQVCLVDPPHFSYGCDQIEFGDEQAQVIRNEDWQPDIFVSPVTTDTINIKVDGNIFEPLQVRVFPTFGETTEFYELSSANEFSVDIAFTTTITTSINGITTTEVVSLPIGGGHVQMLGPNSELSIVDFQIGGNQGKGPAFRVGGPAFRVGGPAFRVGGPAFRVGGPSQRNRNAPVQEGDLYAIQATAAMPTLPAGKQAIGIGYRILVPDGKPVAALKSGAIGFHYIGSDLRELAINEPGEEHLTIHYFDENGWKPLKTNRSTKYNLVSAPSQGVGLYVLMHGEITPTVATVSPSWAYNGGNTLNPAIRIIGTQFLEPIEVMMTGSDGSQLMVPANLISAEEITFTLPTSLTAQEYKVDVKNGDSSTAQTPSQLTVLQPASGQQCFYDRFESGAGQWKLEGQWGIIDLPDGRSNAMTDSPAGSYNSAVTSEKQSTSITSRSIDLSNCQGVQLRFDHVYQFGDTVDQGIIEVSIDNGEWIALDSVSTRADAVQAAANGEEWHNFDLTSTTIPLPAAGRNIRLRFSLEVDQNLADRGWVIDNVEILATDSVIKLPNRHYLPLVNK